MLCLKHFLAFFLLLPFPAAPPIVTFLFAIVMFHRFRACAYCSVLVLLLFFATCKTHFLSLTLPERSPDFRPANTSTWLPSVLDSAYPANTNATEVQPFQYSAPVQSRCWCDLNGGRLFWPVLEGYKLIDVKEKAIRNKRRAELVQDESATAVDLPAEDDPLLERKSEVATSLGQANETNASQPGWMSRLWQRRNSGSASAQVVAPPSPADAAAPEPPQEPEHPTGPITSWEELGGGHDGHQGAPDPEAEAMPIASASSALAPQATVTSSSTSSKKRRIDLRFGGLGVVLDLGFTRSEEAVRQEVEEWLEYLDDRERGRESGRTLYQWWKELGVQNQPTVISGSKTEL